METNKIPTAEEFFNNKSDELNSDREDMPAWMFECAKEFAKLHVKAALEAAALSDDIEHSPFTQKAILNAYQLDNIK